MRPPRTLTLHVAPPICTELHPSLFSVTALLGLSSWVFCLVCFLNSESLPEMFSIGFYFQVQAFCTTRVAERLQNVNSTVYCLWTGSLKCCRAVNTAMKSASFGFDSSPFLLEQITLLALVAFCCGVTFPMPLLRSVCCCEKQVVFNTLAS